MRCVTGKRMLTLSEAMKALDNVELKRADGLDYRQERRFYRCPHCDHFHLTSLEDYLPYVNRQPWESRPRRRAA